MAKILAEVELVGCTDTLCVSSCQQSCQFLDPGVLNTSFSEKYCYPYPHCILFNKTLKKVKGVYQGRLKKCLDGEQVRLAEQKAAKLEKQRALSDE